MKKLYLLIIAPLILISVMACDNSSAPENFIESEVQAFALEAVSSSMILNYSQFQTQDLALDMTRAEGDVAEEDISDIDDYIEMVEALLGSDQLRVESEESDLIDYANKILYSTTDINGDTLVFTFYYNEVDLIDLPDENSNLNMNQNHFIFNDEDDDLAIKWVQGILFFNEISYKIEGKVLNLEGKELVRLRSYTDEDNYVMVNYQMNTQTNTRQNFIFKLVEEGIITKQSKVMIFENDEMLHIQLEMIDGDNYSRYQFHVRSKDGVDYIHINYMVEAGDLSEQGNIQLTKTIDPESNEVVYEYAVEKNAHGNMHNSNSGEQKNHKMNHQRVYGQGQYNKENNQNEQNNK